MLSAFLCLSAIGLLLFPTYQAESDDFSESKYETKKIPFDRRNDLGDILQHERFRTGAELGVQEGKYAVQILSHWKSCWKYYLVDCWKTQSNYNDSANNQDQEQNYNHTLKNVRPYVHKVVILRMYTSEAAKIIKNNSLNFVYVDARHDYCGVKADIDDYWPKIRPGGIMAGHGTILLYLFYDTTQSFINFKS